ncbi:MAG: protein-L-isoaspartate(D-aspartate) O-methyltransferase, partial [Actinomycetota bacterium]|nr:protein-L-isoaspartate(D-aspartate) O-methyltransferase [Actinomycetota bacterium]
PFDRIVATVGCNDLSPAWFEQLSRDGFILCPTRHGHAHPIVRAQRDGASRFVAPSGFVRIRGRQDQEIWWPPRAGWIPDLVEWEATRFDIDERTMWHAGLYVALRDARGSGPMPLLVDGESVAILEAEHGLGRSGEDGDALAARLVQLLDDWESLGRPMMADYVLRWETRSAAPHVDSLRGPWRIHRVHHDEIVSLSRA